MNYPVWDVAFGASRTRGADLSVGAESTATLRAFRICLSVSVLPSIRKR
jgi:hypothetical protein